MDVAATINPATVHFRSLTEPARVHVLEQNYEYDLLDPASYCASSSAAMSRSSARGPTMARRATRR